MSALKKIIIIVGSVIALLLIVFAIVLWTVGGNLFFVGYNKFFIAPNLNKAHDFFNDNAKELTYVAKELLETDYSRITVQSEGTNGENRYSMRVKGENSVYETIPVPDKLIGNVAILYERGIRDISYSGDYVNFTLWSTMDESRGIIYSVTGVKPEGEQLIEVRRLKDNWYYYVHNYEKAKERYPEKFK